MRCQKLRNANREVPKRPSEHPERSFGHPLGSPTRQGTLMRAPSQLGPRRSKNYVFLKENIGFLVWRLLRAQGGAGAHCDPFWTILRPVSLQPAHP